VKETAVTKLFTLLLELLGRVRSGPSSRAADPDKPLADLVAEAVFDGVLAGRAAFATWAGDAHAGARRLTASLLDRTGLVPVEAQPPALRAAGPRVSRVTDPLAAQFAARWPQPGHARVAAGLFTTSFALVCAGLVGAVAVVNPSPALPLERASSKAPIAAAPTETGLPAENPSGPVADESGAAATKVPVEHSPTTLQSPVEHKVVVPQLKGALPVGKGMYIWLPERVEGGSVAKTIQKAKDYDLSHIYVRTGSSRMGFYAQDYLNEILPAAHAAGIRVYGWDFPYLTAWGDDVHRSLAAIHYTTPDGHRIDGFAADIETKAEGTNLTAHDAGEYGKALRKYVGPNYPLIAVIPNPTRQRLASGFPFAEVTAPFDAIAPMVYWMNREPGADVAHAMQYLAQFGKPIHPIGQAYDGAPEGGPAGVPGRGQIIRFMQVAEQYGAPSVSFWSWQHATDEAWHAIWDAAEFRLHKGEPKHLTPAMVRSYQHLLNSLGFIHEVTGQWDGRTFAAVSAYQNAAKLPMTGVIDERTFQLLFTPFGPPIQPTAE
jgi:hypothetical protein